MLRAAIAIALVACSAAPAPTPLAPTPPPAPAPPPPPAAPTPEAIARAFIAQLEARDYAGAAARFDDRVRNGLPVDKLQAGWEQVEHSLGALGELGAATDTVHGTSHVIAFDGKFGDAHLSLEVTVDESSHIAGFMIRPGSRSSTPWQPPPYAHPDDYVERAVTVGSSPALPGTLTLPRGAGPFPAVVLVHGSGPNDADETIGEVHVFADLAAGLASRGIAVLRYVKRTRVDATPAAYRTQRDEVEVAAHAAVALLASTPEIDRRRIALVGHSQGAELAP